jgi:hypothetical protein
MDAGRGLGRAVMVFCVSVDGLLETRHILVLRLQQPTSP